jgi:hypothetical protein
MSASTSSSRACYSAICRTSSGTWSIRARATVGPRNFVDYSRASAYSQSAPVTSFVRVISGVTSLARVAWGRTVEHSRTIFALRFVPIFSRIRRDIRPGLLNFCRRFGSGKPSFLRSLVQHPEKSGRSVAHGFQFAPVPLCAVAHVSNMHRGASENAEIKAGNVRNVVR